MKSMRVLTVFGICMAIWFMYDGYQNWVCGLRCTLSWLLYYESFRNPVIPMIFGLVCGMFLSHLFWNTSPDIPKDKPE
jgi:hypothetical protein